MKNRKLRFSLVAATLVGVVPVFPAGCSSSATTPSADSGTEDSGKTAPDAARSDAKADAKSGRKDSATGSDTSTGSNDTGTKGDSGSDATIACVPASCAPYTCGAAVCLTTCMVDTDCSTGNYCTTSDSGTTGACVPLEANGQTCGGADQCANGFCASGVCCNVPCNGTCLTCASGTCGNVAEGATTFTCMGTSACSAAGTCLLVAGQDCSMDTQCVSGECEAFDGGAGTCM